MAYSENSEKLLCGETHLEKAEIMFFMIDEKKITREKKYEYVVQIASELHKVCLYQMQANSTIRSKYLSLDYMIPFKRLDFGRCILDHLTSGGLINPENFKLKEEHITVEVLKNWKEWLFSKKGDFQRKKAIEEIFEQVLDILELETAKKQNVSNIFVLHSLNGDTLKMWGQDIKEKFGEKEIDVIMPEFPIREESKYEKFKEILEFYINTGKLNNNSIVVAHSIGNAYFIRFCKEFNYEPKAYIAVAPGAIYEYPSTRNDYIVEVKKQAYLKQDSFDYIKNISSKKYCLYSDEDDKNIEKFTRFINDTNSEGIYLKYYNHFDGYHRIYRIPELVELINNLL